MFLLRIKAMQFSVIYRSKFVMEAYKSWIPKGSRVIDIGCGDAIIADEIRKCFKCDIVGADIIDSRKRDVPIELEICKIPDKSFDIATLNEMLHHCKNWQEVLGEAKRVAHKVLILESKPSVYANAVCAVTNIIHYGKPNWRKFRNIEEWGFQGETRFIKTSWWYPFKLFAVKL